MNIAVLFVVFGAAVLSAQAQEQSVLFNPACQEHLQSLAIVMSGNADCTSFNQRIVQSQACVQNAIALSMNIEQQEAECASQCPTAGENTRCNEVLVPVFEKLRDDRCYCGLPESDVNPGVASNGAQDRFFCTNQRPIGVDLYEMCENPPATAGPANNGPMVPTYGGPTPCDEAEQMLLEAISESDACDAMQESAAMASRGEQCPSQEIVQACIEDVAPMAGSAQQSFCSNKCNTIDLVEQALLSFLDRQDAQAPAAAPMPPTYGSYGTMLPIYAPTYAAPSNGQLADTNVCKLFMTTMAQFYLCPPSDGSQINTDFFPTPEPTSAGFAPMLLSAGLAAVPLLATALLV